MKVGLAGLPMSGKTTVFNLATRANAQVRDFLAQSEEVNTGVIKVPDARIDYLASIYKPRKTIYATVEFTDIPGVSKDEVGFSRKTLGHIRVCDALLLVIRLFGGSEVPHIRQTVDPARDLDELCLEFVLADLELVEKRLERLTKDLKVGKKPESAREMDVMTRCQKVLEAGKFLSTETFSPEEEHLLKTYRFLTQRPMIVVGNGSDDQVKNPADPVVKSFLAACEGRGLSALLIAGKTEMEIASLSPEEEAAFLKEYGIAEPGRTRLIQEAYRILNYISFLTVGEDEVRAWPIRRGTTAVRAAGAVHSDIERGFIRAEVVAYRDFVEKGGMAGVKQAGLARLEGKDYIVEDGDIVHFRFSI
ncbi:MAG: GTP-binding and nucleic acid-binding protein YchF [Candidatus Ozemobacter sibiricus]|jgi:GTP-binding protein YchF|uniref:GTP-binding and nucleic acid-binding protein YchF n=1 Tax=Candidatus Ozemobacter sibiricus TaxID=2268124 RepID=A0A367ZUQ4_9BACT|nr:MAG: GTP-binding and nucleic acid-binding protein YchF [Candidatus Ozemobacter sibiricus]